jgi:hypothetical protein
MSTRSGNVPGKKLSQSQWNGIWYAKYKFQKLFWNLTCNLLCRGRPKNCPIELSDLIMLHNKASEGLLKPDRVVYDLYSGIADTKASFLKYCKPFEKRLRSLVPTHHVVPV